MNCFTDNCNGDECNEKTEEEYEEEMRKIEEEFPNAKFTIAINYDDLDEKITDEKQIVIKNAYTCYCYEGNYRPTDYFIVSNDNITNRIVIQELIRQGFDPDCNHNFLEFFHKTSNSDSIEFEMYMGS